MKQTGVFVTDEERQQIETEFKTSGMFLSGGIPMSNPQAAVEQLRKKYNMPEGTGLNIRTGEFVNP